MAQLVRAAAAAVLAMLTAATVAAAAASAQPSLVYEPATDTVLHAVEIDKPWFPASLTKMMTAYVVFEAIKEGKLDWVADVPISEYARGQPATRLNLRLGIPVTVEQAVHGLILRSANDLAVALAEVVSGSEEAFVERMNATALRLGMSRSKFANPHGLPGGDQVTTARDMAILAAAIARDFPDRMAVFTAPLIRIHKGAFANQNDLLVTLPGADGMKTGFTCGAGYNVVASAARDGRRLIAVVLGEPNRVQRSQKASSLLEAGFAPPVAGSPAPSQVKLAGLAVEGTAAEAADASRKMRLRKCFAPDRVARGTAAPAAGSGEPAADPAALGPLWKGNQPAQGEAAAPAAPGRPAVPPNQAAPVLQIPAQGARPAVARSKSTPPTAAPAEAAARKPAAADGAPAQVPAAAAAVKAKATTAPAAPASGPETAAHVAASPPRKTQPRVKSAERPGDGGSVDSAGPEFPQAR